MVIYDLGCRDGHRFEGWFQDLAAFQAQHKDRQLECPSCGSHDVERLLTGSAIRRSAADKAGTPDTPRPAVAEPAGGGETVHLSPAQVREALGTLAAHLRANSDDVGERFYTEARRIHLGLAPERAIRGTTTDEEERKLVEEEIPFLKIPVPAQDD
ncbi:MAG: DUF1178 family protein [Deltaproteobacteria bacterium]|nr:DUF1178 family protein [Deltaproteobacteria bacterium]